MTMGIRHPAGVSVIGEQVYELQEIAKLTSDILVATGSPITGPPGADGADGVDGVDAYPFKSAAIEPAGAGHIGPANAVLLPSQPGRIWAKVHNLSETESIWYSLGSPLAVGEGLVILPQQTEPIENYTGVVFAISENGADYSVAIL
jgi:hypothetical protein